jgi:nucleosome binding factor SPN SPT16 subunit
LKICPNGIRYSIHLVDTVRVGADRATLLTEGCKASKETLFFINQEEKPAPKAPKAAKSATNGSPMKNKVAGGKMLRNKTRSAAQQEVLQSVLAKTHEHQRELHESLQSEGMAKYAEEADGAGKSEGKAWKRFQSYKGEAALPKEVESLRVMLMTAF